MNPALLSKSAFDYQHLTLAVCSVVISHIVRGFDKSFQNSLSHIKTETALVYLNIISNSQSNMK